MILLTLIAYDTLYRIATEGKVLMQKKYDRRKLRFTHLAIKRNINSRSFNKCQINAITFDKYWDTKLITIVFIN